MQPSFLDSIDDLDAICMNQCPTTHNRFELIEVLPFCHNDMRRNSDRTEVLICENTYRSDGTLSRGSYLECFINERIGKQ